MRKIFCIICIFSFWSITSLQAEDDNVDKPVRILISGSLSPQGMQRLGKAINVVSGDKLQKKQSNSIADVLSNEVGISTTGFGPGSGRPIIRGQTKDRVRILENGLENGDVSSVSDDHAVTNDPFSTDRIDILRGASALMYGGQSIGGLVDIIDESIAEDNIGKDLDGQLKILKGDSASGELSASAKLKGQADSINWHFSTFTRKTQDIKVPGLKNSDESDENTRSLLFDNSNKKLANSDIDNNGFKLGLSKVFDNGYLGLAIRHTDSNYGVPASHGFEVHTEEEVDHEDEHEHHEELEHDNVRIDMQQDRLETRGAFHIHEGYLDSIRYGLAVSDYEHRELDGENVGTLYARKVFEGRCLVSHHHEDLLEGGLGFQINYDELNVSGEEAFIPSANTFTPALFLVEDFSVNKNLIFQLGLRTENVNIDPGFTDKAYNIYSASTGLILNSLDREYSASLNLALAQKAPNNTELFAYGAHLASQTFEIGNANLKKEQSLGMELILSKLKGASRGSLNLFIQDYSNYINLNSLGYIQEGFSAFEYSNINARFWGFEADIVRDILNANGQLLSLAAGFDMVRATDLDRNRSLARITPIRTKLGLNHRYSIFSNFIEIQRVESQNRIAEFETSTPGYSLLNMGSDIDIYKKDATIVQLFVKANNLTNEEAKLHTSFIKDQAPLRGRAFFAGINVSF